jgi:hypothetical protein
MVLSLNDALARQDTVKTGVKISLSELLQKSASGRIAYSFQKGIMNQGFQDTV